MLVIGRAQPLPLPSVPLLETVDPGTERAVTVEIELGPGPDRRPARLDLEELLATRLLVQGNSGSGKSHLLRRLLEQSAPWVQQCVVDPEGDFVTLADRFGHLVVEAERSEAELTAIAARVRQHRVSVVLNLEGLDFEQQMRAAAAFLGGLFDADRDHWFPMLVVVDEAQLFAPAAAGEVSDEARKLSLGAMTNLMCRGRKRGLAGVIATQRLAKLAKNVAAEASNFLMGRTFLDIDMQRAADLLGMERRQAEAFRDLPRGSFVALGPALSRRPIPIAIGPVETSARSTSPKLAPLPEAPENPQDLIFSSLPEPARLFRAPRPQASPAVPMTTILADLAARRVEQSEAMAAPVTLFPEIDEAERDEKIETVMAELLADPDAGFRPVAVLYQDFLVRLRIRRVPGEPPGLPRFKKLLAVGRAGVSADLARDETWGTALRLADAVPEEMQGLFLCLARAALARDPCPPDATLARVYGTHSPGRVRRLLGWFEERNLLVLRTDFQERRIVAFPELGCETAPGDPAAPDERPVAAE